MRKGFLVLICGCLLFASCDEYPVGAVVAIKLSGVSSGYKPAQEFKSWLVDRMRTFSAEKKDFSIPTEAIVDSNTIPAGVTHLFIISVDSINLVPLKTYQSEINSANTAIDKFDQSALLFIKPGIQSIVAQNIFRTVTYNASAHPSMKVFLEIRDVKTGKNTWDYSEQVDLESNAAMPEEEQLGQLFAALKGLVANESGFLIIHK